MMQQTKYQATIDRSVRNNSHTLALAFVQYVRSSGLNILEVGCSSGYFGASLIELGHHVTGVEMDEVSSRLAASRLHEVHCCTVQDFFVAHPDRIYDVIVFGDVIEHLADPAQVLIEAGRHLHPQGRLICSIPNVAHAVVRGMLLDGGWNYSKLGILDETHLRFFTKSTILQLFEKSGFETERLQSVRVDCAEGAKICQIDIKPKTLDAIMSHAAGCRDVLDFQYVISARAKSTQPSYCGISANPLRVLAVLDDPDSHLAKIRILIPVQRFCDEGCRELKVISVSALNFDDLQWCDVVIVQRAWQRTVRMAYVVGKPVIYEIDDLITGIPDFLSHHEGYIKNRRSIQSLISQASLVTVTHARLKREIEKLNGEVMICPNYANPDSLSNRVEEMHDADGAVTLIVASSDRIMVDFLLPALQVLKAKYGAKIHLVCIGALPAIFEANGIDCEKHSIVSYEAFGKLVGGYRNAIGLIPLDDSLFSSCKSAVKYFDYSRLGVASVCSNVSPYRDVIENEVTGLLVANESADWVVAVSGLIDNHDARREMARAAQRVVAEEHSIDVAVDAWRRVFAKVAPNDQVVIASPSLRAATFMALIRFRHWLRNINKARKDRRRARQIEVA
jgi:O-antigen biosynthesis protein